MLISVGSFVVVEAAGIELQSDECRTAVLEGEI
jgi:hypothetical protein